MAKSDGSHQLVVDYRALNKTTVSNAYPLPLINSMFAQLTNSKFFSKFDLVGGAYQLLRVAAGSEKYRAFRTLFGVFELLVMRDGLKNAPAVFQQFLNELFADLLGQGVIIYIDEILCGEPRRTLSTYETVL